MYTEMTENGIFLREPENFDPFVSCECGQCFRFETRGDEVTLYARRRKLCVKRCGDGYLFEGVGKEEFESVWYDYFDLGRDYAAIIRSFSGDAHISRAAEHGGGIRIFRQDPWETLVSLIISQNNNIPRIKKIINSLCVLLGEDLGGGNFAFPEPRAIAGAGVEGLAPIRAGFRAKYIYDAAVKTLSGEVSAERIKNETYEEALAELKKIKGVGDKVANCVLLFGYGFTRAFPVDVWVKRVIAEYYGEGFDPASLGEYAGIAQQYLFYNRRNVVGEK